MEGEAVSPYMCLLYPLELGICQDANGYLGVASDPQYLMNLALGSCGRLLV